jgi:hypothetical protein
MNSPATTDHRFDIQPRAGVNTAASQTPDFLQLLNAALAGGNATFDFFSGHFSQLMTIMGTIATGGDEVWLDGTDENNMPISYVAQGDTFVTVSHTFTDTDVMRDGTGSKDTIKPVGVGVVTFTTDQGTSQLIIADVSYGGYGLAGLLTMSLLTKIGKSLVTSLARFIAGLARRLYARVTGGGGDASEDQAEEEASSDAEDSATETSEEGVEVADGLLADITISVAEKAFAAVGVFIAVVVFILQLLSRKVTAYFRFYNQTALDVNFGVCKVGDDTGMMNGPATVGQTVKVSKIAKSPAPPGVMPSDKGIFYSEAQFINDNLLAGIGYIVEATSSGDFPGFRVLVNIPAEGENSLYVELAEEDCNQLWTKQMTTDDPQKDFNLTATANSGRYKLSIATNANKGQSPSPYDGSQGYNYEHLLVLTDGSA